MPAINDVCLVVEDLHTALAFYRDTLGFSLRRHAPGFADFLTNGLKDASPNGVTLALWERRHMFEHVGIPEAAAPATGHSSMIAIEVASPAHVDQKYRELTQRGVFFVKTPKLYPWNAYACYFEDPDHHVWEIYAWGDGGHAGLIE